jgi:hypothetical protein
MWIPQWLTVLAGASLVVLVVVLGFVANYGGLRHAWDEYEANSVAFENTTDQVLCAGDGGPMDRCFREIKPRATSKWSTTACTGGQTITVFDLATQTEYYERYELCGGFDGARIIINQRDGEFIVADSLLPASPGLVAEATAEPTAEATVTP